MATWGEFEEAAPEIAVVGRELLEKHVMAYLATTRPDGSPRVNPVSPFILNGRLFVSTPRTSPKGRDQARDGRYMMHMLPGEDDAEFSVRGTVREVPPGPLLDIVLAQGPHWVKAHDFIFEYDVQEAATAYWENVGQPGTYPVRRTWRATATGRRSRAR